MRRRALIRRTQSDRVDFAFVLYRGNHKTYKVAVAMPMPGKLLWSVTLDPALDDELGTGQPATHSASFELKGESAGSVESDSGPLTPNGSHGRGTTTMSGRGWYTHGRIYTPKGSRSVVDGAWATIAIR